MNAATMMTLRPSPGPILGYYPEVRNTRVAWWHELSINCTLALEPLVSVRSQSTFKAKAKFIESLVSRYRDSDELPDYLSLNSVRRLLACHGLQGQAVQHAMVVIAWQINKKLKLCAHLQQFEAALAMIDGRLVEMATGEGKTIAVYLAAATAALAQVPTHVLSANSYLAQRDEEYFSAVNQALGISTGVIAGDIPHRERAPIYAKDLVYSTASEVVFDYLNDQIDSRLGAQKVMRGLCFALIDEADSILLDEAKTPFVIAGLRHEPRENENRKIAWSIAQTLNADVDYSVKGQGAFTELSAVGRQKIEQLCADRLGGLWVKSSRFREELIRLALNAKEQVRCGIDYVVTGREIAIIDKNTGRIAQGRRWSHGLHQMIEIKEGLEPSPEQVSSAQLTFQRFFPRYLKLAGASATLRESRSEIFRLYGLRQYFVNLRTPSKRRFEGVYLLKSQSEQFDKVCQDVREKIAQGRPVLIGSDSVQESELIFKHLLKAGVKAQILNAQNHAIEARLIELAGQSKQVTVATNMAGRGTDIRLSQNVVMAGGLHVISMQGNSSSRIDRQLAGRCARQGDPGSVVVFLSWESGLLKRYFSGSVGLSSAMGVVTKALHAESLLLRYVRWREQRLHSTVRRRLKLADQQLERQLGFGGRAE
jgi:preprotein translocase subunit SecA